MKQEQEQEAAAQRKAAPQKRFISDQEALTQQLANLKKTVA